MGRAPHGEPLTSRVAWSVAAGSTALRGDVMADLAVSSDAVHSASAEVAGYLTEFEARLRQTAAKVSAVVGSDWSGGAAKEFHAGWVEWTLGAAQIHASLAGISRLLSEAAVSYEASESEVKTGATGSAPTVAPVIR